MNVLGIAEEHVTFWWTMLGLGFVVEIAVIILLSLLVTLVREIDDNVQDVWDTATRVAQNTATIPWMLRINTVAAADELLAEVGRHASLLTSKVGGR
ncbi:MAG: hypothetical protein ACRD0D_00500 [Acidimicrobiales bacterium]